MINLILGLALLGLLVYLIITYIPMPAPFKNVIVVIAVVFLILIVMHAVGFVDIPVPRVH
jgi:peptidoglycan/LPS O-acetylase OafA/YrhL